MCHFLLPRENRRAENFHICVFFLGFHSYIYSCTHQNGKQITSSGGRYGDRVSYVLFICSCVDILHQSWLIALQNRGVCSFPTTYVFYVLISVVSYSIYWCYSISTYKKRHSHQLGVCRTVFNMVFTVVRTKSKVNNTGSQSNWNQILLLPRC